MNKFLNLLKLKFSKKYRDSIVNQEYRNSKKHRYATFEEFLRDLPEYQIKTDFISLLLRNIYSSAGVNYQQWVFIDKGNQEDKTAWLRREKNLVLHEKGSYLLPWVSNKKVMYFDLYDSRPLIDLTDDMDWRNGDMCADVVTAVTNSNDMKSLMGSGDNNGKYIIWLLALNAIALLLIIVMLYTNFNSSSHINSLLDKIIEQTKPIT